MAFVLSVSQLELTHGQQILQQYICLNTTTSSDINKFEDFVRKNTLYGSNFKSIANLEGDSLFLARYKLEQRSNALNIKIKCTEHFKVILDFYIHVNDGTINIERKQIMPNSTNVEIYEQIPDSISGYDGTSYKIDVLVTKKWGCNLWNLE